jgi:hypothetical protein
MAEIELAFLARQLDRVLDEQRLTRGELQLMREQLRIQATTLARLEDTLTIAGTKEQRANR